MNTDFMKIDSDHVRLNLINLKHLVFEVTDVCNLRCKYCGYGDLYEGYDPRKGKSLSFKKARNILDFLSRLWRDNIVDSISQPFTLAFYGGEPLICMGLIKDIIEYAESLNISSKVFHYNMTTNGLLLHKYMDYLADKNFDVLISLDGTESGHSYRVDHRGNNSHKQVVDNVKILQLKYPEYFKRHVRFNTVLHNRNSVGSAYQFIHDTFNKLTSFSQLNNSGIRSDKVDEYYKMFQKVESSIEENENPEELEAELFLEAPRVSQLTNFLYKFSGNMFDDYLSLFSDPSKEKIVPTGTCTPFSKKMFITVNGKILPCERVNHEYAMGQVFDDKVEVNTEFIAEMYNSFVFKFIKQCQTCSRNTRCYQCVFQVDDLNESTTKCTGYINERGFQAYVNLNLEYLGEHPKLYKRILSDVHIEN